LQGIPQFPQTALYSIPFENSTRPTYSLCRLLLGLQQAIPVMDAEGAWAGYFKGKNRSVEFSNRRVE
jgi:hypothetical protein